MSGFSAEWLALARALRSRRAQRHRARRGRRRLRRADRDFGRRSRLRHRLDAARDRAASAAASELAAGRQRSRPAGRPSALGRPPHVTVIAQPVDLVRDLELALDGPLDLVTTSALLDLVSAEWLDRLIVEAAARRLPVYAALTYDGRTVIEPAGVLDSEILAGFNAHQRTDKGFGPALGPTAAARAIERFEHFGYSVVAGPLRLGVRAGRSRHPGRAVCRLGRGRRADHAVIVRRDRGWLGAAARRSGGRAARTCASVTSTSSRGRSARAER